MEGALSSLQRGQFSFCTFGAFGEEFKTQPMFECSHCALTLATGKVVCAGCARLCHDGAGRICEDGGDATGNDGQPRSGPHLLGPVKAYCDCCSTGRCKLVCSRSGGISPTPPTPEECQAWEVFNDAWVAEHGDELDERLRTPDYGNADYWDDRYKDNLDDDREDEWLLPFSEVKEHVAQAAKELAAEHVDRCGVGAQQGLACLVVGCGDSAFSADLHDSAAAATNDANGVDEAWAGPPLQIMSTDVSESVIAAMAEAHAKLRPALQWQVDDACKMALSDECFDLVIDKGLVDCLFCAAADKVRETMAEAARVLRPGGRYMIFCFSDREEVARLLKDCTPLEIHRLEEVAVLGGDYDEGEESEEEREEQEEEEEEEEEEGEGDGEGKIDKVEAAPDAAVEEPAPVTLSADSWLRRTAATTSNGAGGFLAGAAAAAGAVGAAAQAAVVSGGCCDGEDGGCCDDGGGGGCCDSDEGKGDEDDEDPGGGGWAQPISMIIGIKPFA
eukprot:g1843.t1